MSELPATLGRGVSLRSDSGHTYTIKDTLVARPKPFSSVFLAESEGKQFVIKDSLGSEADLRYRANVHDRVADSPHVRARIDTITGESAFVMPYMDDDLLQMAGNNLFKDVRKNVLRQALCGLRDLHDKDLAHNDVKPNNIFVDYQLNPDRQVLLKSVKIGDLEEAVVIPPGNWLRGPQCGNKNWRSPEAWARAGQNQASDIYSFAVIMIYVMHHVMVFYEEGDNLLDEDQVWRRILWQHVCVFGDREAYAGYLEHVTKTQPEFAAQLDEMVQEKLKEGLFPPFRLYDFIEPEFRDLVGQMTNLNPLNRITAKEALQHVWFTEGDEAEKA
ncbi:serine/threonine protein kinase [Microdochium trichocladiopsis]|uniref:Serine/threonine protein kinase n=1 Tax=Microdochium trichocladiopsis TaxID=1682393 RepID=A0A9P9BXF5_9PEZI|nr:serine/threonine protein kinase [Microdochium trichocladiopsis]KAH7036016.1 serine/threonine protein kinase [Microdochium trichocladiopsis]